LNRDLPVALGPSTLLISVAAATLGAPFLVGSWTRSERYAIPADHHRRAP